MSTIILTFKKEILAAIRDRRTILMSVVIPILIIPLLLTISDSLMIKNIENSDTKIKISILKDNDNHLKEVIENNAEDIFTIVTSQYSTQDLDNGEIDVIADYDAINNVYTLIYNGDNTSVSNRISHIRDTLVFATKQKLASIVEENNIIISPMLTANFLVKNTKLPSYTVFKSLLMLLLPIIIVSSSMSVATDVTVGEKERRTLESILCVPCNRWCLVIGKFLASWLYSCVAALLSVVGYIVYFMLKDRSNINYFFEATNPLIILDVVLISLSILSLAFLICSYARSIKEAQTYSQVLMISSTIIALLISSYDIQHMPQYLHFIPLVNNTVGVYAALNDSFNGLRYFFQIASTMVLVGLAIYFSKSGMMSERRIYN